MPRYETFFALTSTSSSRSSRILIGILATTRCSATAALGRKNYLFMRRDDVGKAAAVLYSIMASAKATLVEPFS